MRRYVTAAALLIALAAGAAPARAQDTAPLARVTLPPELDRVLRDYERNWKAGNAAGVAALFTEDGLGLSNGRTPARGRAEIAKSYGGAGGDLRLSALAYGAADTVGYIVGLYRWGADTVDTGKFVLALRRAPRGPWLIAADIDNTMRMPRRE